MILHTILFVMFVECSGPLDFPLLFGKPGTLHLSYTAAIPGKTPL